MKLWRLRYYKRSTVISVSRIDPSSEATRAYPAQAVDSKTLGSFGDGSIHFVTILLLLIDENRHLFAPAARNANHGKIDVNPKLLIQRKDLKEILLFICIRQKEII